MIIKLTIIKLMHMIIAQISKLNKMKTKINNKNKNSFNINIKYRKKNDFYNIICPS